MIHKDSRFIQTPVFSRDGQAFIFNIREPSKFTIEDCVYYTFVQGDTLDGIAYKLYGNAKLGWAILDVNNLQSELDFEVGKQYLIPNFEEVLKYSE